MRLSNIILNLLTACFIISCSNNDKSGQNNSDKETVNEYVYGITDEQDTHPDSVTVMQTFNRIQSVPDKFIVADSIIIAKDGGKTFTFKLFYPFSKISEHNDTLKCAFVLIPELNHETPKELKETILKSIAKNKGLYEIDLYSSMTSFYEQIKNDAPSTATEMNKKAKIIWDGFIGNLHQGKYYEYEIKVWH
jgi:hypothetical protein